jgi:hypothetical protein
VTISLSTGARRLARAQVVVKRLVAIEDLGNIQVLCTDKTGTLTQGRIRFEAALDVAGAPSSEVLRLGLLCNEAVVEGGRVVAGWWPATLWTRPCGRQPSTPAAPSVWPPAARAEAAATGPASSVAPGGWPLRRSTTTAAWPRYWSPNRTAGAA